MPSVKYEGLLAGLEARTVTETEAHGEVQATLWAFEGCEYETPATEDQVS
jgi:hypothetical protein